MIWKNQRFHLIYEYIKAPLLPPPLNIFIFIFYSIKKLIRAIKVETEFVHKENEDRSRSISKIMLFRII